MAIEYEVEEISRTSIGDVKERFKDFLYNYRERKTGLYKYRERLNTMAIMNQRSLVIDFDDLLVHDMDLARIVENYPDIAIEAASQAIKEILLKEHPDYAESIEKFYPRFRGLPKTVPIRRLGSEHIGKMISVEGILVRLTRVEAKMIKAYYIHVDSEDRHGFYWPEFGELGERLEKPIACPICGKSGRFQLDMTLSKYIDWQKIVVQEKPEEVPPGQMPRSIEVMLTSDLVDIARPGDRVTVNGILRVMPTATAIRGSGKSVFNLYIDANYIDVQQKVLEEIEITRDDEEKIRELARDPWIHEKITLSIAPSIYGHWDIKKAIALSLFGGVPKILRDGTRIRGDIHVLLVGDPGIGKSMLLQYAARLAPRAVYTTGKGSSAAGLTAAVLRDKQTGEYYLEAGALVIADGGVAVIDEIDKMRPEDRVAIHEAMEQQSYHKDFEIMLANGSYVRIGELVDKLIEENRGKVVYGKYTEILYVNGIKLYAFDPDTKSLKIVNVDRVSRHKAPKYFIKIVFSNGTNIMVTPEHPIVILDGNDLTTIPAEKVRIGIKVPGIKVLTPNIKGNFIELTIENVEKVHNKDSKWVYDITIEPYHLFVSHGLVLHNSISIAKAGIVARLNARAAVLAAGNPKYGRYDPDRSIADNINLPPTILSRFDLIFVMKDIPSPEFDRLMARHILRVHEEAEKIRPIIPPDLLRKYISYARRYIVPRLSSEARKILEEFYVQLRRKGGPRSPIPITARQLEALVRLAEAHARMALRNTVTIEDAEEAIRLMSVMLSTVGIDVETGAIDIDTLMLGRPRSQQEKLKVFMETLNELLEASEDGRVSVRELTKTLIDKGLTKEFIRKTIRRLIREGELYEPEVGYISRV